MEQGREGFSFLERRGHAGLGKGLHLITYFKGLRKTWPRLTPDSSSICLLSPLTFLKAVPEGARAAHGASLLIKRHAGVSQSIVAAGVIGDILIGQAVVAQPSEVDLSCRGWAGCC